MGRGEEGPLYVTPDLSYYWEGAREKCEDNKRDVLRISFQSFGPLFNLRHPMDFKSTASRRGGLYNTII